MKNRHGEVVKHLRLVLIGAVALALGVGCTGEESTSDATAEVFQGTSEPSISLPAGPAAVLEAGLYDCGPFFTRLGREMTYYVRLSGDGSIADVMSRNDRDAVVVALDERRSDDLSTDIGVGTYVINGDQFNATTTDSLSYRIEYEGIVISPTELRLRIASSLYDFDVQRTCTKLTLS